MNRKPRIAVSGSDFGGRGMWLSSKFCVWLAGGKALRVTPSRPLGARTFDGLILGGGSDLHAELYGQERTVVESESSAETWSSPMFNIVLPALINILRWLFRVRRAPSVDSPRDVIEMELLEIAKKNTLPVLGICRGHQLLNVFHGGTLHQDLSQFYVETPKVRSITARMVVRLTQDSKLKQVIEKSELAVNALHNQGVATLGKNVVVNARDSNGIIQGLEIENEPFMIGVQWHPEFLPHKKAHLRLFECLVAHARSRKKEQTPMEAQGTNQSRTNQEPAEPRGELTQ